MYGYDLFWHQFRFGQWTRYKDKEEIINATLLVNHLKNKCSLNKF
jgi:hypothetical protein